MRLFGLNQMYAHLFQELFNQFQFQNKNPTATNNRKTPAVRQHILVQCIFHLIDGREKAMTTKHTTFVFEYAWHMRTDGMCLDDNSAGALSLNVYFMI